MRGRFSAGVNDEEWCERRLLARVHSYTIKRLRAEIEPVAARDFLRFLFAWQRVADDARMEGPDALDEVVGQLEGFGAPAGAWETEILPARLAGYEPAWLDDRCLAGRVAWTRLGAPQRTRERQRAPRRAGAHHADHAAGASARPRSGPRSTQRWMRCSRARARNRSSTSCASTAPRSSTRWRAAAACCAPSSRRHSPSSSPSASSTSDSFAGLRALLVPSDRRQPLERRAPPTPRRHVRHGGRRPLGARAPRATASAARARRQTREAVEHLARTLLRRYGVVFWRLLEREAGWLPPWRDLLRVYRTLERRGEIRGGRFVAGFSGEQFALPDAVGALREVAAQAALRRAGLAVRRRPAQPRRAY